jgi:hypothetical protein
MLVAGALVSVTWPPVPEDEQLCAFVVSDLRQGPDSIPVQIRFKFSTHCSEGGHSVLYLNEFQADHGLGAGNAGLGRDPEGDLEIALDRTPGGGGKPDLVEAAEDVDSWNDSPHVAFRPEQQFMHLLYMTEVDPAQIATDHKKSSPDNPAPECGGQAGETSRGRNNTVG